MLWRRNKMTNSLKNIPQEDANVLSQYTKKYKHIKLVVNHEIHFQIFKSSKPFPPCTGTQHFPKYMVFAQVALIVFL